HRGGDGALVLGASGARDGTLRGRGESGARSGREHVRRGGSEAGAAGAFARVPSGRRADAGGVVAVRARRGGKRTGGAGPRLGVWGARRLVGTLPRGRPAGTAADLSLAA